MFNPVQMIRVLTRAFGVLAPFLLMLMLLSVGTELYALQSPQGDLWRVVVELWPGIVRDMLPGVSAMFLAYWLAARFMQSVYGLEKVSQGFSFLWRWRFGQTQSTPYLMIREGRISMQRDKVLSGIGGPGNLVIYHDSAVVLRRAGHLTGVTRSGFVPLEPFEKVYKVLDLRPKRSRLSVEALTREGIPVTCEAEVRYQVRAGDQGPTKNLPFPVSNLDVLRAATCTWKCDPNISEDGELDWDELVAPVYTSTILRSILAHYPLSELIRLTRWEEGTGWKSDDVHPRQAIGAELERTLRLHVSGLGVQILSVNLGEMLVPDEVADRIATWKKQWERQLTERRAEVEAEYMPQMETVKARAQAEMMLSLTEALPSLVIEADPPRIRQSLLHIIAMLKHASQNPGTQAFLPSETQRSLTTLGDAIAGTEHE